MEIKRVNEFLISDVAEHPIIRIDEIVFIDRDIMRNNISFCLKDKEYLTWGFDETMSTTIEESYEQIKSQLTKVIVSGLDADTERIK